MHLPKPPKHLTAATRKWWSETVREFELEAHHLRLLTAAAEAWDRVAEAREKIATEGSFYQNRFNEPRAHPALAVERDNRIAFARLLRELALDVAVPSESRPPAIRKGR